MGTALITLSPLSREALVARRAFVAGRREKLRRRSRLTDQLAIELAALDREAAILGLVTTRTTLAALNDALRRAEMFGLADAAALLGRIVADCAGDDELPPAVGDLGRRAPRGPSDDDEEGR